MRFLFLALLVSLPAHAALTKEQCGKTVDLESKFPPNKNQAATELCFAYASSDLLSEAMGLPVSQTISAKAEASRYVALTTREREVGIKAAYPNEPEASVQEYVYSKQFDGLPVEERGHGFTGIALSLALKSKKLCLDSDMASADFSVEERDSLLIKLNQVPLVVQELSAPKEPLLPLCVEANPKILPPDFDQWLPNVNDWVAASVRMENERRCSLKTPKNLTAKSNDFVDGKAGDLRADSEIISFLARGRPVGLDFDLCQMEDCARTYKSNHAVVVIGKRWNAEMKTCEIRIRNSWGPKCSPVTREGVECERGNYWVNLEESIKGSVTVNKIIRSGEPQ